MCKFYVLLGFTLIGCFAKPQLDKNTLGDFTKISIGSRRGFGDIVTPEPESNVPTLISQTPSTTPAVQCKCVQYYLCNPENGTVNQDGQVDRFGEIDIRFNQNTCEDYLDVCCLDQNAQSVPLVPVPSPNPPKGCGVRNVGGLDFNLVGNNNYESGFGEFPWTVALLKVDSNMYFCAGSLIHPQVLLTSNHCIRRYQMNEMKARAGEWDAQTVKERLPYQERNFQRIISHPNYEAKTVKNNFGLVILESPFELLDHINVVCLPPQNFLSTSSNCYSSGWGKNTFGVQGEYSAIMKSIPLPMVPFGECQNRLRQTRLGNMFILDPSFICAGGHVGVDTCEGDGGGPLICPIEPVDQNRYYLTGIVSWGIGCHSNSPAAYANVAMARDWIDQQLMSLGYDTSTYIS